MTTKLFTIIILLFIGTSAFAQGWDFTPGLSASSIKNGNTGTKYLGYGADLSLGHHISFSPNDSAKPNLLQNYWLSAGAVFIKDGQPAKMYGEAGFYFIFNIGAGYSMIKINNVSSGNVHIFLGLPLPLTKVSFKRMIFIEPYYRFRVAGNDQSMNEYGALLKMVMFL